MRWPDEPGANHTGDLLNRSPEVSPARPPVGAPYVGRFAPSPTGLLHAGSVVAALASWLDARAHNGAWLVRMEDVDQPRCHTALGHAILQQLAQLGLHPMRPVVWQSQRTERYLSVLQDLQRKGLVYGCTCTRKDIADALALAGQNSSLHTPAHTSPRERHAELIYPGTCRLRAPHLQPARSWRFAIPAATGILAWSDRRLGLQRQNVARAVGDFVVLRADGYAAYQLAVVVDDWDQGVTHIVRGEDLADNTPRQMLLQAAIGAAQPRYLHTPLVYASPGNKLSKHNGAPPVPTAECGLEVLRHAAQALGLRAQVPTETPLGDALGRWVKEWRSVWVDHVDGACLQSAP
jgi:glutamyl-Q tRNA(Asp) synthetase